MLFNAEIERSVLGCLIIDNTLIENARVQIKPSYFNVPIHRKLYEEILECNVTKKFADITVLKTLDLESLISIVDFVPSASSYEHYKNELIDLAVKRELISACDNLKKRIMSDGETSDVLKCEALNSFNEIKTQVSYRENTSISQFALSSLEHLENRHNGIVEKNRNWGIKWLDAKTGGIRPGLTYLAARPSVGKTALALQIGKNVAKQGGKVALFSLEMDAKSITNRLICNEGNINKNYFDRDIAITEETWVGLSRTAANISTLQFDIFDKCFTIEEILLNAEELRARKGLDFLIIDYIQLCETIQKYNSPNERISYISRQLKKYQQRTGIHVLALSQFNRETELKKFPTLANLRDSGALEQDANNVLFLHDENPELDAKERIESKELVLVIAKQREGERNIFGKINFYGAVQRFYDK